MIDKRTLTERTISSHPARYLHEVHPAGRQARMNLNDQKYVDQKTYEIWSARCTPEPGDILITREAPMGESASFHPANKSALGSE